MVAREYPGQPLFGVGGVVVVDGHVVLIKRKRPPLAGSWSLPGGVVELGESLRDGLRRELREEIGIEVQVGPLLELFDRITRDGDGMVRYHYILADYLCRPVAGALHHGSDAEAAILADPTNLSRYNLSADTRAVIASGLALC